MEAASNIYLESYRRISDSRAVVSLSAEIQSTLDLSDKRKYVSALEEFLAKLEKDEDLLMPNIAPDPSEADPVLNSVIDRIGLLGPDLAYDTAIFYQQSNCIRSDIRNKWNCGLAQSSIESKKKFIAEDLRLWDDTEKLGKELIPKLKSYSRITAFQHSKIW